MGTPPSLRVTLLGDFTVARGDEQLASFRAPSLQSLLAFLIIHRHAPQPRQRLAFLLWPDSIEAQARTNLRRELHHLRRALPHADQHLQIDSRALQWRTDSSCKVDLVEFEASVARADPAKPTRDRAALRKHLVQAVDLYGGDLLPSCYEEWIEPARQRLRRSFAEVLECLIDVLAAEGDPSSAIRYAERLVNHDPLREASYARLMELNRSIGDRAAALRVYERCESVLEREMGVRPGPVTVQARDLVTAAEPRSFIATSTPRHPSRNAAPSALPESIATPHTLPLFGRERERAAVREWMECAERADGREGDEVLLLLGEPGIGKTRLLEHLDEEVRARGGRTVRGRGFEAEMVRPYGAWIDALRSVPAEWLADSAELGALVPGIGGGVDPVDRGRLFDGVARWLAGLAAEAGPVVVLIDDVQWLDEASAGLLHYVIRLHFAPPVRVACAARSAELENNLPISRFVHALQRRERVRVLEIAPMDREDILALARAIDARVDGERVFAGSGGNPLFALELARAIPEQEAGDAGSIGGLIRNRLARLAPPARELISWAAALGRSFDPSTISLAAGQPLPGLLPALDQLEHHGIIRPAGSCSGNAQYDFAHDIVRDIAYHAMSEPRRRLVHLQIARKLSEASDPNGAVAGEIAHHAALGGDPALAAAASVTAAKRCLRIFAYTEAAELARRGIEHTGGLDEPRRVHLHLALLRVAVAAGPRPGSGHDIEGELRALVADARSLGMVDEEAIGYSLLSVLNYGHQDFGSVEETSMRAAEALTANEDVNETDPAVTAHTLAQSAACLVSIEREMPRAEELLLEADALARESGVEVIDVPMGLGILRYFEGDYAEATRLLEHGWRLTRRDLDHFRACECLAYLVMLQLEIDAPDRALAYCRELSVVAAKFQEGSEAPFADALRALARYRLVGEEASEELERTLDGLRRMNASRKLAYVLTSAADVDLRAGRVVRSRDRAAEALEAARLVDHRSGIVLAAAALVRALLALDDSDAARQRLDWLREKAGDGAGLSARAREALAMITPDTLLAVQPDP